MNDMTMGQRIAVRRKLTNMSQEALAAQLDVSRQAISKWESDAAIPDVDKLIALSKIFGVSVGWLLGTEREGSPLQPLEDCLTEAQMQAVEEIVARNASKPKPRKPRLGFLLGLGLAAAASVLALVWGQFTDLVKQDAANQLTIQELHQKNEDFQEQLDTMEQQLKEYTRASRLLSGMHVFYTCDNMDRIHADFTFTPKIYQEGAEAYLSISHSGQELRLPCVWDGEKYTLETELDPRDGYRFSFLLVSGDGFREQSLMDPDFTDVSYLSNVSLNRFFHLDPQSEQYQLMQSVDSAWLDPNLTEYTFDADIYSPRIFPEHDRAYQDIVLTLQLNDEIIWKQSLLEDFLRHSGGHVVSLKPFPLQVAVELPELKYGDRLQLNLLATLENGNLVHTPLDRLYSWERPE